MFYQKTGLLEVESQDVSSICGLFFCDSSGDYLIDCRISNLIYGLDSLDGDFDSYKKSILSINISHAQELNIAAQTTKFGCVDKFQISPYPFSLMLFLGYNIDDNTSFSEYILKSDRTGQSCYASEVQKFLDNKRLITIKTYYGQMVPYTR